MTEELCEFLKRKGWASDTADKAADAYGEARGNWRAAVWKTSKWMDDDVHDYTGELFEDIREWMIVNGESGVPSGNQLVYIETTARQCLEYLEASNRDGALACWEEIRKTVQSEDARITEGKR